MAKEVQPIPEGYEGATPYLCIKDAASALSFYARAFGAVETMRMETPDGKIAHAEIRIGKANIMLADEFPDMGFHSPVSLGGTPVFLMIYVPDVDAFVKRAVDAGAELTRAVEDQFYGDRSGQLKDPFGHAWNIATHVEDVSDEEMKRRMQHVSGG